MEKQKRTMSGCDSQGQEGFSDNSFATDARCGVWTRRRSLRKLAICDQVLLPYDAPKHARRVRGGREKPFLLP